jgi:hypothetical protein
MKVLSLILSAVCIAVELIAATLEECCCRGKQKMAGYTNLSPGGVYSLTVPHIQTAPTMNDSLPPARALYCFSSAVLPGLCTVTL